MTPNQAITDAALGDHATVWEPGQAVEAGDLRTHDGIVYAVIQPHATQADWPPASVPALFRRLGPVGATGPQPWVQPTGAHDAYQKGDRVTFQGRVYESLIDANVWSPAVYPAGWELIPA